MKKRPKVNILKNWLGNIQAADIRTCSLVVNLDLKHHFTSEILLPPLELESSGNLIISLCWQQLYFQDRM